MAVERAKVVEVVERVLQRLVLGPEGVWRGLKATGQDVEIAELLGWRLGQETATHATVVRLRHQRHPQSVTPKQLVGNVISKSVLEFRIVGLAADQIIKHAVLEW